jgi:hypothetical protein
VWRDISLFCGFPTLLGAGIDAFDAYMRRRCAVLVGNEGRGAYIRVRLSWRAPILTLITSSCHVTLLPSSLPLYPFRLSILPRITNTNPPPRQMDYEVGVSSLGRSITPNVFRAVFMDVSHLTSYVLFPTHLSIRSPPSSKINSQANAQLRLL